MVEPGKAVEAVGVGTFLERQVGRQLLEHSVELEDNIGLGKVVEIHL